MYSYSQRFITGISGGDIGQGFCSGMMSSAVSSLVDSVGGRGEFDFIQAENPYTQMFFGTVSGGLGAKLMGGNFWEGAAIGLTVSGLNHGMHKMSESNNDFINEDSPGPPGQLEFKDLTEKQLDDFKIIRENEEKYSLLITPENNVVYEVDGFYFKNFTDDKYWYKIGNGNKVTVTYANKIYNFSSRTFNIFGYVSYVGFMPRSKDHWYRPLKTSPNGNPFDCTNY